MLCMKFIHTFQSIDHIQQPQQIQEHAMYVCFL